MARDGDSSSLGEEMVLKKELETVIIRIVEQDDDVISEAERILSQLSELKLLDKGLEEEIYNFTYLHSLLMKMGLNGDSEKIVAAKGLREFIEFKNAYLCAEIEGFIDILLGSLDISESSIGDNLDLYEDICAILFNISVSDIGSRSLLKSDLTLPFLTKCLTAGTYKCKGFAAGGLPRLFEDEELMESYGYFTIEPLLDIIKEGEGEEASLYASKAMLSLCYSLEFRGNLLELGASNIIADQIVIEYSKVPFPSSLLENLFFILGELNDPVGISNLDVLMCALKMLNQGSQVSKNCLLVLKNACCSNNWKLMLLVWANEYANQTFSKLVKRDGSVEGILAEEILKKLQDVLSFLFELLTVTSVAP